MVGGIENLIEIFSSSHSSFPISSSSFAFTWDVTKVGVNECEKWMEARQWKWGKEEWGG